MTVVRIDEGQLFRHSPIALDATTRASLDGLGPVRHLVAPNLAHHRFVGPYRDAHPEATLWAAPGLPEKRRGLRFDGVLGDDAPPAWSCQLE